MKLQPIPKTPETSYPNRKTDTFRVVGRWVRRIGAAVAASSCLWVVGCLPIGLGGDTPMPSYFVCADDTYEVAQQLTTPGSFWGSFCGGAGAEGSLNVSEQTSFSMSLENSFEDEAFHATAAIYDEDGEIVAEMNAGDPAVEVTLESGVWRVVVTEGEGNEAYEFRLMFDEPSLDS